MNNRRHLTRSLSDDVEQRLLGAIDDGETVALLRELIRAPSENPPGGEAAKARVLAAYLERSGIHVRLDEIRPGRPNVVAELGDGDGPTLVLNGHLDTVPAGPGWVTDPFGAELRDGRVYGRGACDMLAGVAAMCAVMRALKRSATPLAGRLVIHAVIDEEVGALGSQATADSMKADWVIVTEPTGGNVYAFGKGQLNVEVTFLGRAAHSSVPEAGHNAIDDAAAFVALVEREHHRVAADPYPGLGPVTFSTGVINGGLTGTIVPAECRVVIDRRLLPTETLDDAQRDFERLLDRLQEERHGVVASLQPTLLFPPFPPSTDDYLARMVQTAVRELHAGHGEITGCVAATDAAWYVQRGMSTVVFGPGDGATAHQPDESVAVEDLRLGSQVLALVATRLLSFTKDA